MRKLFLVSALAVLSAAQSFAGDNGKKEDSNMFNHLSIGLSAGTDGIGLDLAAPIGNHFSVRAGKEDWPKIKYKPDISPGTDSKSFILNKDGKIDIEGKINMADFKLLFDYYPFTNSSFRLTAGAYFGKEKVVTVYNKGQFLSQNEWGSAGIQHGKYKIASDANGNINLDLKAKSFKPYLGLGFGRAVPRKRIGVAFDLGVQFWGTPGVYTNVKDDFGDVSYKKLTKQEDGNKDLNKAIKNISKLKVFPVLNIRLCGRIF
jgi:hypothetical protein